MNQGTQNQVRQITPEEIAMAQQGRQLTPEELQKTQVLNLQEVEEVARMEKLASKKPAIIVAIIGIALLTFGTTFQIAKSLHSEKPHVEKREVPKKTIQEPTNRDYTCTKTTLNNPDGTDTIYTILYKIEENKLVGFTKTLVVTPTAGNPQGLKTIQDYKVGYQPYLNPVNGYTITATPNAEETQFTAVISADLKTIDVSTFPEFQQTHYTTKIDYPLDTPFSTIQTDMTTQSFICK